MPTILSAIWHAVAAWVLLHPFETVIGTGAVVSLINGALPTRVQSGPIGRALSAIVDRAAALARSDAAGTLKWPGVASALLLPQRPPAPLVEAPAPPTRADELDLRATVAPPPPAVAPSPLRAPTLTGVAAADDARDAAARAFVHREFGLDPPAPAFDATKTQDVTAEVRAVRQMQRDGEN